MSAPTDKRSPNRDSVTTIQSDGSRYFLHPADVSGRYTLLRRITALLIIAFYVGLPWIQIKGNPAVFLDVASRRFHLFGLTLATEDLWLLFFFITGLGFTLFFLTALLGRLWCGWACPQTIFMEHVYRRVERWIDGPALQQRALERAPWSGRKVALRVAKHGIFIVFSAIIAHVFLSYFISVDALFAWVGEGPGAHPQAFMFMLAATVVLYFNFAWFREQLCIIICPYGRLQSALIDDDSIIIGYDEKRGEPRGKPSVEGVGDCVDCNRCVEVCPTGIDIRQGLQMECIGCSNCIDACNSVMKKLKRPPGLVRYDSLNGLDQKPRRILRPRIFLYFVLMGAGLLAMGYSATKWEPVGVTVSRMTGTPFFVTDATVRNQLYVRLINKRGDAVPVRVSARPLDAEGPPITTAGFAGEVVLESLADTRQPFVIIVERADYTGPFPVIIRVESVDGTLTTERTVNFLGPDPRLLADDLRQRDR